MCLHSTNAAVEINWCSNVIILSSFKQHQLVDSHYLPFDSFLMHVVVTCNFLLQKQLSEELDNQQALAKNLELQLQESYGELLAMEKMP